MRLTRFTLVSAWSSTCLMKAQTTFYAAFASGALTVAMLIAAALLLICGMRAMLIAGRDAAHSLIGFAVLDDRSEVHFWRC